MATIGLAYIFPPWNGKWWPSLSYPLGEAMCGWHIHWPALFAEWGLAAVATAAAIVLLHKPKPSLDPQQLPKG